MSHSSPEALFDFANHEIFVVTAADQGRVGGQVATWVMMASLVPEQPRVTVAISPLNFTFDLIHHSQRFVLNLLATDQVDWVPRFGLYSSHDRNKFADLDLTYTPEGIPILPGVCGWASCVVGHQVNTGDRVILIADMVAQTVYGDRQPLRKFEAIAALSPEMVQALAEKRRLDIEQSRGILKPLDQARGHKLSS